MFSSDAAAALSAPTWPIAFEMMDTAAGWLQLTIACFSAQTGLCKLQAALLLLFPAAAAAAAAAGLILLQVFSKLNSMCSTWQRKLAAETAVC